MTRIHIEQELRSKAPAIIWHLMSTADGMGRWLADSVTQQDDVLTFRWGNSWDHDEQRTAHIIYKKKNAAVRFAWTDAEDPDTYVELRLERSTVTGDYILLVTDFADDGDTEWLHGVWQYNFRRLRLTGAL